MEILIETSIKIHEATIFFDEKHPRLTFQAYLYPANESNLSSKNPVVFTMPLSVKTSELLHNELTEQTILTLKKKR